MNGMESNESNRIEWNRMNGIESNGMEWNGIMNGMNESNGMD